MKLSKKVAKIIYTVQAGDTLSGISYKLGHDLTFVDTLANNNNIADKNLIYVGQQLVIKDDGEVAPATQEEVATLPAANVAPQADTQATPAENQAQQNQQVQSNQEAPVAQQQVQTPQTQNVQQQSSAQASTSYNSNVAGNDAAAKAWIAARESGGSYSARNGQYIGKYQLSASYLNGDYSEANQERVADQYVASRYGSWSAAQSFWQSHGWY